MAIALQHGGDQHLPMCSAQEDGNHGFVTISLQTSSFTSFASNLSFTFQEITPRKDATPLASAGPEERPKRRRKSHYKTMAGCQNCRARHVKCDERRPGCSRCEILGVECCGYRVHPARSRRRTFKIIQYKQPISQLGLGQLESSESYALQFFELKTVPMLACYNHNLWGPGIAGLLGSECVVRDMAILVGSSHLRYQERVHEEMLQKQGATRHLKHYSRAINSMRKSIPLAQDKKGIFGLACLLLCLSELWDDRKSEAMMHLQNGLSFLGTGTFNLELDIEREVADSLASLGVTLMGTMLLGSANSDLKRGLLIHEMVETLHSRDRGLRTSRFDMLCTALDRCLNAIYHFVLNITLEKFENVSTRDSIQQSLLSELHDLDEQLQELQHPNDKGTRLVYSCLRARCIINSIVLKAFTTQYQTSYDKHLHAFTEVVDLLENGLAETSEYLTNIRLAPMTLRLNIISLLYHLILFCRDPIIRRRALDLLLICPRKEGFWDADEAHAIGKLIIDFEEQGANNFNDDGVCIFIPEENRVHTVERARHVADDGGRKYVILKWRPNGASTRLVAAQYAL